MSYPATLELVENVSKLHDAPLKQWIADGVTFKFIGDNVDLKRGVRDARTDHSGQMIHMYSTLVVRSRLPPLDLCQTGQIRHLSTVPLESFLPSPDDIKHAKSNLVVLVSRLLTQYIKELSPMSRSVPQHIPHKYTDEMSQRSEVAVLDILMKNEARHSDMIEIMKTLQNYLGSEYPSHNRVASGGDQLTCERQVGAQRHVMDGDTPWDRLQLLEPQSEDWHCLVCVLMVSIR